MRGGTYNLYGGSKDVRSSSPQPVVTQQNVSYQLSPLQKFVYPMQTVQLYQMPLILVYTVCQKPLCVGVKERKQKFLHYSLKGEGNTK